MLSFRQFVFSFLLQWSLTVVEPVNLLSVFSLRISTTVKIHITVKLFCLLGVVLNHDVWWICFLLASVARFLESRGMLEDALEVATDPNYRFDLAVQLGRLEVAKVCLFWADLCLWIQLKTQLCYYFPWYLTLQNFWLPFICFWGYWFSLHPFKTGRWLLLKHRVNQNGSSWANWLCLLERCFFYLDIFSFLLEKC